MAEGYERKERKLSLLNKEKRAKNLVKIGIGVISFLMLSALIIYQVSKGAKINSENLVAILEFITKMLE